MIKSLSVENFRCFERFKLDDFRRINIIVGRNAAGKTAFLESIRLASAGTPAVAWNLSAQRGHPSVIIPNPTPDAFEAPWRPLFLNLDFKNEVRTSFTDTDGHVASLHIYSDPKRMMIPPPPPAQPGVAANWPTPIAPIAFDRVGFDGKKSTLMATLFQPNPQQAPQFFQMFLQPGKELGAGVELFQSNYQVNSQQVAQWFSALSVANKEAPIKQSLHDEFNFISDVSIQTPVANIVVIYATMKYLRDKIPLSFVSSGINKLFAFMNAVVTFNKGVVLIDELENGLHSSILPHMWEILHRLASDNGTQLFMTTHSWECLRAVLPLIERKTDDFALIKMERDDLCAVPKLHSGADLAAAVEEEFDFRQ
jgi:hypothetical protein